MRRDLDEDAAVIVATTLYVHCAECNQSATLITMSDQSTDDARSDSDTAVIPVLVQHWTCPYCHAKNREPFAGRLTWVQKGHYSEPRADSAGA